MGSTMRWVVLLSMAVLASSASLDVDLCAKGESFWCQSLEAAEVCSAVDHCTETIWKNQKLEKDESTVCLFCEAVVSDAREKSTAGKSQEEVIAFLSSANDLLPDSDMALKNKKTLARKSIPKILNSEIAPQMVCNLLDVCKGPRVEEDLHKLVYTPEETPKQPTEADNVGQPSSCADCKSFFSALKKLITGQTPVLLRDIILDKLCSRTTTYKTQCENVANKFLPDTINLLASFLDENRVCRGIRMCPKSQMENEGTPLEVDLPSVDWEVLVLFLNKLSQSRQTDELLQPSSCKDCTDFFTSLKSLIQKETSAFITDILLDQVCARLGKSQQACEIAVRSFLPSAIDFAVKFLDPVKVCKATKMCPNSQQSENDLISIRWTKLILPNETNMLLQSTPCPDCTKFFKSVRDLLKNDASAFLSDVLVGQICPLTGSFRKQCEDLAKMYLPVVISLITSNLDPDKVCKSIGMCKKSENEIDSDLFVIDLSSIDWETLIGNQGDSKCDACMTGVKFVQNFVKSEAVRSTIAMILGKFVCVRLGPFRIPCEKFVGTELRTILNLLARLLEPSKVCRIIRLCSKNSDVFVNDEMKDSFPVPEDSEALGVVECTVCETVIGVVRAAIDTNKTEVEILKAMHVLCDGLPLGSVAAVCNRLVTDYGQQIIDSIRRRLQPHDICVKMGLCNAFNFDLLDVVAAIGSEQCIICRSTVQYVEAYIDQTDTVSMIQAELKTLCHSLPPTVERNICLPFVAKYIPPLIHELSVSLPPKFFCTKVGICTD